MKNKSAEVQRKIKKARDSVKALKALEKAIEDAKPPPDNP